VESRLGDELDDARDTVASGGVTPPLEFPELELEVKRQSAEENVGPRYTEARRLAIPKALPFLPEPGYRKFVANVPGDAGFDPAGFCTDVQTFVRLRTAELKHGRIAMFGALAWPLVEFFEPDLSQELRFPDVLAESGGRALYALLDSFTDESAASTVLAEASLTAIVVFSSIFELAPQEGREPGDLGFDPVGLADWKGPAYLNTLIPEGRSWQKEAELKHGRLAMVAMLYDAVDEATTDTSIVEETEGFFHYLDVRFFRLEYWILGNQDLQGLDYGMNPDMLIADAL